jgi:low affinity Fe/Cu permease
MLSKHFRDPFQKFARKISIIVGSGGMFFGAMVLILLWIWSGPFFGFSNTWQLVINTFTTISTFLMMFLLQNSQNHDTAALHVKLNELIRIHKSARNTLLEAQNFDEEELENERKKFQELFAETAVHHTEKTKKAS